MAKIKTLFVTGLLLILGACEKPEPLWDLPPAGPETFETVNMGPGPGYDKIVFYTLSTKTAEVRNLYSWHIAMASGEDEFAISINGGLEVQVYNTGDTAFQKFYPPPPAEAWRWDNPNGNPDSSAFADFFDKNAAKPNNQVYILDLGKKAPERYKKLKVLKATSTSYTIRYAAVDGKDEHTLELEKKPGSTKIYVDLVANKISPLEPTHDWDIVFTKYRHVYYDMKPVTPYYVAGVLLNSKYCMVAETEAYRFEDITANTVNQIQLTKKTDEIGYDWKYYDLNGTGKYVIDQKKIYIIKDRDGRLYKLHFLNFYDDNGVTGFPNFAFQQI